ncbi:hypothetical protein MER72_05265 [Acinetobacter baumannii]|nr:hypothetical protein [Acinetobacter baumannii]
MNNLRSIKQAFLFTIPLMLVSSLVNAELYALNDKSLASVTGQALFNLTNIAANQNGNPNTDVGFYRLGMEAQVELNANIKRLQLGCGGVKGVGCDIDIENISLAGVLPVNGSYAESDAVITNPFIEFAIKSPDKASTREIVGFRLGALGILGKLGLGSNTDLTTLADDTGGINSLSGDLNLTLTNTVLKNVVIENELISTEAHINDYNKPLILNRATSATLDNVVAKTGPLRLLGILDLPLGLTLSNATLKDYPLSGFHEILLAQDTAGTIPTSDTSLSLQKQAIQWQKISSGSFENTVAAQPGWWLSLPKVLLTDIETQQRIDVGLGEALGGLVGRELIINPLDSGQVGIKNCYGNLKFC